MPLNTVDKSFNTLYASAAFLKYALQVNRGSKPPFPSGTNSSQYLATL